MVSQVKVLTFIEKGLVKLDGIIDIFPGVSGVSGHISQDAIFLGESGKITGIPSLLVASDDVQAGHSARIEKISDEKLFYVRSRGIDKQDATILLLQQYISETFSAIRKDDDQQYKEILETLFRYVCPKYVQK